MMKESLDFLVFKGPFDEKTWILLFSSSIFVSICITILWKIIDNKIPIFRSSVKALVMTFKANMGTARFPSLADQLDSYKVVIFIALLMGNVIWLSYNGALLSGLLAPKVKKPFESLESLLTSDYR